MVRQFLKPGITGWAQVNGYRGETQTIEQMQKRVEYDLWYLENWTPWLDLRIVFLTAFNYCAGRKKCLLVSYCISRLLIHYRKFVHLAFNLEKCQSG